MMHCCLYLLIALVLFRFSLSLAGSLFLVLRVSYVYLCHVLYSLLLAELCNMYLFASSLGQCALVKETMVSM